MRNKVTTKLSHIDNKLKKNILIEKKLTNKQKGAT